MRTTLCYAVCVVSAVAPSAQVKFPEYQHQVLANGVVVDLVPKPGIPLVNFRILVKGGLESEPAGQAGLVGVTAQLLRRGTSKRTADQFSDELDSLGGTFVAGSDEQSTFINAEFLKKDFDAGLDLAANAVLRPAFPEAEVAKMLAQRVDGAKSAKDNPGVIGTYYRAFFFGPRHPYGRQADELSYQRIRRDDIVSYHQRQYVGKNVIVVVSGDFDTSAVSAAIAKVFGAMPAGTAYSWTSPPPPARGNTPRLLLIDKPDATQTYFWIGQPGIARTDTDRVPLWLMNTLFGGRFTSLLNDALRVKSGLTYGASSSLQQSRLTGSVAVNTYTKTDTTVQAIDMALDVLKKFQDGGLTAEQLASIKAYTKGLYPRQQLETSNQLAMVLGEMELLGLNRGEVDDLFSRIDSLTLEQANATIKKYYRTDNLAFVILGNAAKIRDAVRKYAPKMAEVSIKQPGIVIPE